MFDLVGVVRWELLVGQWCTCGGVGVDLLPTWVLLVEEGVADDVGCGLFVDWQDAARSVVAHLV